VTNVSAPLSTDYCTTRELTEELASPLSGEDQAAQSMPDVSPTKWHRAHTTWFFEPFVLERYESDFEPVDRRIRALLDGADLSDDVTDLVRLGLHHEQQHQELMLMDIKHVLSLNPSRPGYRSQRRAEPLNRIDRPARWTDVDGGVVGTGHRGDSFAFDNEQPFHHVFLEPFRLANRLVTAGDWTQFIVDGGYQRADLWLSDGWHTALSEAWTATLYWRLEGEVWMIHTLGGTRPVIDDEPVCHVSFYEADAYARWAGARPPTEFEWEYAATSRPSTPERGFDLEQLHPSPAPPDDGSRSYDLSQLLSTRCTLADDRRATRNRRRTPMTTSITEPTFDAHLDPDWSRRALIDDVPRGLGRRPLRLPPRWLYDDRGSELFEKITGLAEYYPTEAERSILRREATAIAELTKADMIIELGSGTSDKTHTLLRAFTETGQLRRFIPFDVSEQTLRGAAVELSAAYSDVQIHGVVGDFARHLWHLPTDGVPMITFLGSTIGDLYMEGRRAFVSMLAEHLPAGGWLLLGVDLVKPVDRLVDAYDDPHGVTAEFTRNVLHVLNHELHADFDVAAFDHVALWDPSQERMNLRLRVNDDHLIAVADADVNVELHDGEEIRIEISTKFRLPSITSELAMAGFTTRQVWTDRTGDVAVLLASVDR